MTATPPKPKREKALTKKDRDTCKRMDRMEHFFVTADADETWWRHNKWAAKREKVRKALVLCHTGEIALNHFDECGGAALIEWSEKEQRHRITAQYCHCRHCEPCATARGNRMAANLKKRLAMTPAGPDRYRFVTLTMKHSRKPLHEQIKKLYADFRTLRKTKLWTNSQKGGAAILEVKYNALTQEWHPHLHIICEGDFLAKDRLSREWHRATGDSKIVDVKALKNAKTAAHYVTKYITKGTSDEVWESTTASTEWITSTKGVRTAATFGTWRGFKLLALDKTDFATDWQPIALLATVASDARRGVLSAINLLVILDEAREKSAERAKKQPPD